MAKIAPKKSDDEINLALNMSLPANPPILPMLAKRVSELPLGADWIYEPKWDGFRALIFRDGNEILLQSREQKSLNRYFPELLDPLRSQLPDRCVLDGEIVIANRGALDFDALQLRIHPAASRVKLLSHQMPASIVFFDLLSKDHHDFREKPFIERRSELESILSSASPPLNITPATDDPKMALDWFRRFEGAGLDGVMAKPKSGVYEPDKRVMFKVKHERDCDCVVAGFRWYRKGDRPAVGSLLLGLYDDAGSLQHVGVCGSFPLEKRYELVNYLAPYRENALADHPWNNSTDDETASGDGPQRMPGGQSRWSQGKDLSWEPLRIELVAEVAYEHMQSGRFRHMAQFLRWRFDKPPKDCTYAQLEVVPPEELMAIFPKNR
ncbi:ATP-dependent DNA ligase [Acidobacterium sp. S8]|uniref:ATP-dependent DNA ligase n=1 Tax=Acidobacterium sp. S8 TaxID=1641854 RepID=UPI0020B173A2|nr:ATP-dependent DNA ligase [Acidobacterium sp. S8]